MVSGPQDITMKTLFEAGDYPGNRLCLDESIQQSLHGTSSSAAFTALPQCCGVTPRLLATPVPCAPCVVLRFNKLETAAAWPELCCYIVLIWYVFLFTARFVC